jgi:hypothetical protein
MNSLSLAKRHELQVKTLALLRLNHCNVRKTSREARITESTIRNWLRLDNEISREIAKERAEIQEQQRKFLQHELAETQEINDLHNASLVSEQVEKVVSLAMDGMTNLANELIQSLITDLLTGKAVSFQQRAWAFGVLFDKIMVYQGNPTSIHATLGRRLSREERAERAKQLLETAEQRRKKLAVVPRSGVVEPTGTNDG